MEMLPQEIQNRLPKLYSQEQNNNPSCILKYFMPSGSFTWYAIEGEPVGWKCSHCGEVMERHYKNMGVSGCYNCGKQEFERVGDDWLFFGKVYSEFCPHGELGYFTLNELKSVRCPLGLSVERDLYWKEKPLSSV